MNRELSGSIVWSTSGSRNRAPSDPYTLAWMLIAFGIFLLLISLFNWRIGYKIPDYYAKRLNIIGGILAIILGLSMAWNIYSYSSA